MITVGKQETEKKVAKMYPRLMGTNTGLIVLFCRDCRGTVLDPGTSDWEVGSFHTDFCMDVFEDIDYAIVLKNN